MTDLKPCPFCGGQPYMNEGAFNCHHVSCQSCQAKAIFRSNYQAAASAWNTRATQQWRPIETAPRDNRERLNYILISVDGILPDLVIWHNERKEFIDKRGTAHHRVPAGWFNVGGGRSRLCGKATHWTPLPEPPTSASSSADSD